MQQDNKAFLKTKIIENPRVAFTKILQAAANGSLSVSDKGKLKSTFPGAQSELSLTANAVELGLLLLNEAAEFKEEDNQRWPVTTLDRQGQRYFRIVALLGGNAWEDEDNYNLLLFFFGAEKAAYMRHAWRQAPLQMYQEGYARRSFRSPHTPGAYLRVQLNSLIHIIVQAYTQHHNENYDYISVFYDLTLVEQIRYNHLMVDRNPQIFRLWSAALDLDNAEVFGVLEAIIYNKDPEGKLTTNIIKALLNSNKEAAWELVAKLLLSAQRQEGLRQTILESLDETSIGALKYIMRVVVDNDLVRFSSVVRALDVWVGMGWGSEKENTVKKFLQNGLTYLDNPEQIPVAIQSDNNAEVFMALWAQGVYDVQKTIPYLQELYRKGDAQKRTLALLFAEDTWLKNISFPLYVEALEDTDLQPLGMATYALYTTVGVGENATFFNHHYPTLFDLLHETYKRVTVKEKTFEGAVFSWLKIKFERANILMTMIYLVGGSPERLDILMGYFDEMDSFLKRMLTIRVLPEYTGQNSTFKVGDKSNLTPVQHYYAMMMLKDRNEYSTAYEVLFHTQFTPEELSGFPALLKRKTADFRSSIITLLLRQPDKTLAPVLQEVLTGDIEQRVAGLDMLLQLKKKKRMIAESAAFLGAFRARKSISAKEEILLAQLGEGTTTKDVSAQNGYGLYDPKKCVPIVTPEIDKNSLYEKLLLKNPYAFSLPIATLKEAVEALSVLYEAHKTEEFSVVDYNNTSTKMLLGNALRLKQPVRGEASKEDYETYPLHELWSGWYDQWKLVPRDLFLMQQAFTHADDAYIKKQLKQLPLLSEFVPERFEKINKYNNPILAILRAVSVLHPMEQEDEFLLGAATRTFAGLGEEILKKGNNDARHFDFREGWQNITNLHTFFYKLNPETMDEAQLQQCWNLYNWRQYAGLEKSASYNPPPLMLFGRAYEKGIIGENDLLRGIMIPEHMQQLSAFSHLDRDYDYIARFPFMAPFFEKARDYVLDLELKRGDTPTSVSEIAAGIKSVHGVHRFAQIIAGLGKTTLQKAYYADHSKADSFSDLLSYCISLPTDTLGDFTTAMQQIKVSDQRLVEVAIYAPQWQWFISNYLGWKGLDSAIWWMHAHTKTAEYEPASALLESEVARYSSLDIEEFKQGAVDKEWFLKAYKDLGAEHWSMVYDAAKYISDGNGHRRARIYADVLLGTLSLKTVTEKITAKRDQDYVRIYGLVPLNKTNKQKDVLARYEFLQQFKKESKQFGAQKQASEALSIDVSMQNLARNAGYPDPIRLTWAMETKQVQAILSKETQVQFDDVLIGLVIGDDGVADVVSFKGDKVLKDIPAKYKKDKQVEALVGYKKTLREQFRRSRIGLEEAMMRGDVFTATEIQDLCAHPVIAKHLEKLVFITDVAPGETPVHGFFQQGKLVDGNGVPVALSDSDGLRIAHCTDLYETKSWAAYQRLAFEQKLQQPFKQIFRELYLPTADELEAISVSRRYAGHQVQPAQTLALLRSRGWKIHYDQGLQKVYHKEGFAACMYAMADWFSPADVENPTLETVQFIDLKTQKNVAFDKIHPRIFSEIMRDIDLVVSVAHAGAVDPEASHSSIEMRTALLLETIRLFKLDNVTVKGSHALIKGTMGEYSVHLGSAVVHRILSGYLSILPVHSQQRGRLFLPFMDDDPRSAELLSKVLLLSRDNEIQDPTILRQLADK